jgi:hypothetical protein
MLTEVRNPRQVEGEGLRRWFTDEYFDLIVWHDAAGEFSGFQLCYDKAGDERALTWRRGEGYSHERVDDGEIPGRAKMSPILVPDGAFARNEVAERFLEASAGIEQHLRKAVHERLLAFPL